MQTWGFTEICLGELLLYADTDGRTDRHDGINGLLANVYERAKNKYVVKLHFKDTEVPAYGRKPGHIIPCHLYQILLEH